MALIHRGAAARAVKALIAVSFCIGAVDVAGAAEDVASDAPSSVSSNIALVSDYVFRGYTQNLEDPAIQGGLDWDSGVGLYAGAWASNAKFGVVGEGSLEWDLYAGYKQTLGSLSYDVGALAYVYPGAGASLKYDWWESHLALTYDFGAAQATGGIYYTPDYFGGIGRGLYYAAKLTVPLGTVAAGLAIDGTFGRTELKGAATDYSDFSVGLTYTRNGFGADLRYFDTNVKNCRGVCDGRLVLKISRVF